MGSPFRTWRDLFGRLCEVLNMDYYVSLYFEQSIYFLRQHGKLVPYWEWNWWSSTSQRDLDTALRALFESEIALVLMPLADIQEMVRALFHSPPEDQVNEASAPTPWMALLIMLLMRGANPHGWADWNDLDVQLYVAIVQGMTGHLPWEEGGEEREGDDGERDDGERGQ